MEMKPREIADRYQRRGVSIKILAELNGCEVKDIKEVLKMQGIEIPEKQKKAKTAAVQQDTAQAYPEAVQKAIFARLDSLEATMQYHEKELKTAEAEYLELVQAMGLKPQAS